MSLKDTMQSGLEFIEKQLGSQTFRWNNEDYLCVPSGLSRTKNLEIGGFEYTADEVINVRYNQFANAVYPSANEQVVFKNINYRIIQIIRNANDAFMRIVLVETNKGV